MTIATKYSIEIQPAVYAALDPAGVIEAMKALEEKRNVLYHELLERHFPTFTSGEMMGRAQWFINTLAQNDVERVEIEVVLDGRSKYATWLKIFFRDGKRERLQNSGWSMPGIARDVAYRFQAFANLLEVPVSLKDTVAESGRC